jgi:pentapeptide MXKDX repeat protein
MKKLLAVLAFVLVVPSIAFGGDAPPAEEGKKEEPKKDAKKKDAKKKDEKKKEEEKKDEGGW